MATRVLGPQRLQAYADMLQNLPTDPVDHEFDELPADADEPTRQDVAERMAPYIQRIYEAHPALQAPHTPTPHAVSTSPRRRSVRAGVARRGLTTKRVIPDEMIV